MHGGLCERGAVHYRTAHPAQGTGESEEDRTRTEAHGVPCYTWGLCAREAPRYLAASICAFLCCAVGHLYSTLVCALLYACDSRTRPVRNQARACARAHGGLITPRSPVRVEARTDAAIELAQHQGRQMSSARPRGVGSPSPRPSKKSRGRPPRQLHPRPPSPRVSSSNQIRSRTGLGSCAWCVACSPGCDRA